MEMITIFTLVQLITSNWDVRGFTLESSNMEKGDGKVGQSVDNEPTTGEQLGDSEKVRWQLNIFYFHLIFSLQMIKWLARSYGLRDAAYHEAYNTELHRQARTVMV